MTDEQPRNSATTGGANGQDLSVGSRIAGYVVGQRLGAGGMAVVYRAADQRLGRQVALKILAPHFAADDAFGSGSSGSLAPPRR
jgi:serine/threonine-protein kinase